jgi:hypothetical protein
MGGGDASSRQGGAARARPNTVLTAAAADVARGALRAAEMRLARARRGRANIEDVDRFAEVALSVALRIEDPWEAARALETWSRTGASADRAVAAPKLSASLARVLQAPGRDKPGAARIAAAMSDACTRVGAPVLGAAWMRAAATHARHEPTSAWHVALEARAHEVADFWPDVHIDAAAPVRPARVRATTDARPTIGAAPPVVSGVRPAAQTLGAATAPVVVPRSRPLRR